MQRTTSALLVAVFVFAGSNYLAFAGEDKDKAIAKDKAALQGTWAMGDKEKASLTFAGDKFTLQFKGGSLSGTYSIDPTQKPKTIDMLVTEAEAKETKDFLGKTSKGVFEIDGAKLKWAAHEPGRDERPKAFPAAGEKSKVLYMILEREKK